MNGLFERIAGEHAEQHRESRFEGNLPEAVANLSVDMLVVRRFAPDDGAEAKHSHVLFRLGQALGD